MHRPWVPQANPAPLRAGAWGDRTRPKAEDTASRRGHAPTAAWDEGNMIQAEGTMNTACIMSTTERKTRAPGIIRHKSMLCHKDKPIDAT